jgi:cytochrome c
MKHPRNTRSARLGFPFAAILAPALLGHAGPVAAQGMSGKTPAAVKTMQDSAMKTMEKFMAIPADKQKAYVAQKQKESMGRGEVAFKDTKLGTNGFSCATCHPGGKTTGGSVPMGMMQMPIPSLQGVAAIFPKFKVGNDAVITLADMNNNCIVMFLNGEPLKTDSQKARDLAFFVTGFSQGVPYSPGKQAE